MKPLLFIPTLRKICRFFLNSAKCLTSTVYLVQVARIHVSSEISELTPCAHTQ